MSSASALLDRWLSRLGGTTEVDLVEHGSRFIPELLRAYAVDDFELRLLEGSWLRAHEGHIAIELTAELARRCSGEQSGVVQRRLDTCPSGRPSEARAT